MGCVKGVSLREEFTYGRTVAQEFLYRSNIAHSCAKKMKLYFAYGSNFCLKRFKNPKRVPSASFKCLARLEGHRVVFQKRSVDGSGKATIVRDPNSDVIGALFAYEDEDLERLKKAEAGYSEQRVTILTQNGKMEALTFMCEIEKLDSTLKAYDWYLALIRCGGRSLGLPEDYLSRFDSVTTKVDDDLSRVARERAFLE
jgi:Gamma-glutamyl cyclotransferase, AIG2-like